jgi:vacuolar-type H+-ATPase subunit E/Vma4
MLTQVENEFKSMKEEAREEAATMKEDAKKLKETANDMVAKWTKDSGHGCFKDA